MLHIKIERDLKDDKTDHENNLSKKVDRGHLQTNRYTRKICPAGSPLLLEEFEWVEENRQKIPLHGMCVIYRWLKVNTVEWDWE